MIMPGLYIPMRKYCGNVSPDSFLRNKLRNRNLSKTKRTRKIPRNRYTIFIPKTPMEAEDIFSDQSHHTAILLHDTLDWQIRYARLL